MAVFGQLERDFFRALNGVVEPALMRGLGFPRFSLTGLVLLESVGFKSGKVRRTPLVASRAGSYYLVSTVRAGRSFWVKNLQTNPKAICYAAGDCFTVTAVVIADGRNSPIPASAPFWVGPLVAAIRPLTHASLAVALLLPAIEA